METVGIYLTNFNSTNSKLIDDFHIQIVGNFVSGIEMYPSGRHDNK